MKVSLLKRIHTLSWITLIAAVMISFPLLFGLAETQAAWDGKADDKFSAGSGTEASPYLIRNENHMGYFIRQLDTGTNFEGKYIKLDADLDMTGHPWTYDSAASFAGTFLGYAHTVKTDCTLLPDIAASGVVTGLNVEAKATVTRAILCDYNHGLIQMCSVRGSVVDDSANIAGAICAENAGTVQYCGAVGSISASGSSSYAAFAAKNSGYVIGCYAALNVQATGSDRYSSASKNPIAVGSSSKVTNNYFNSTLYTAAATTGRGITTDEMKSAAFLNVMAINAIPGYTWTEGSDGYPTVDTCGTAVVTVNGAAGTASVFHNSSTRYYLNKSVSGGTIYYTLDGSDPREKTAARKTYSSSLLISGDTVLNAVVYVNNEYGPVMRHTFIQLKGGGTASNPYQITTKRQLDAVRLEPDKYYELKYNLTYTAEDYALGGVAEGGWVSIPSFSGTFDGNGYSITGLRGVTGGLFDTNRGTIRALRLLAHELYAEYSHGSLVNDNYGTVTQCYAKSAFTKTNKPAVTARNAAASTMVGGLVGCNIGTVSYSRADGMVIANSARKYGHLYIGGIVGYGGSVESCIFGGTVASYVGNGSDYVFAGGISGEYSSVANCLHIGNFDFNTATCYQTYICGIVGGWNQSRAVNSVARDLEISGSVGAGAGNRPDKYDFAQSHSYCYKIEEAHLPADCPALDFSTVWMITEDGPFPQGVMDEDGHCWVFSRWISDPSCTADGSLEIKCDLCTKTETRTIKAPGHNVIPDAAVESTCTAPGKTAGSHCGRCGTVLEAQGDVPQLEHNYVNRICTECSGKIPTIAAGKCGDSLSWELGEDGVLLISGSGAMWDRDESAAPLWYAYRGSVKEVRLPAALHSVGAEAFRGCTALTQISLSRDILTVGENAFADCTTLSIIGYTGTAAHTYAKANSVPFISLTKMAETPTVTSAPASAEYIHGEPAAALTVTASVSDGGVISWQWFASETAEGIGTPIDGATDTAFIPDVSAIGVWYYYAVITNTNEDATDSQSASVRTDTVSVTVRARVDAAAPVLSEQPVSAEYILGDTAKTMSVTASVSDGGTLLYQWYVSDTADGTGTAIDGAAEANFTPPTNEIGTKYYYAVITNTNTMATGETKTSVTSVIASVTVSPSTYTVSGRITSVGEGDITVELLADGAAVEGITVTVTADTYTITNVPAGTYTLRISKPLHVTREFTVTAGKP